MSRKHTGHHAQVAMIDWRSLRQELGAHLAGYALFVELRDGTLRPVDAADAVSGSIVALAAMWPDGGLASSEEHAWALAKRLAGQTNISALVLISRAVDPFGYYVRLSPRDTASEEHVLYNGRRVRAGWPERVAAAQQERKYVIGGVAYPRIPYGDETGTYHRDGEPSEACHDCAVLRGQFHVGPLCDNEECPRCHGQVVGCDCPYEDEEG